MTKNFDQFIQRMMIESISLEKLSPDDYEMFEDFVSLNDIKNGMFITGFEVEPNNRGNGVGTSEITRAVRFADNVGSYVFLQAYPYDADPGSWEVDQKRLINFYSRFGFVHVGQGWMFRQPKIHESLVVSDVIPPKLYYSSTTQPTHKQLSILHTMAMTYGVDLLRG